eukprot:257633-Pyramimonas_sp.AAC.1
MVGQIPCGAARCSTAAPATFARAGLGFKVRLRIAHRSHGALAALMETLAALGQPLSCQRQLASLNPHLLSQCPIVGLS